MTRLSVIRSVLHPGFAEGTGIRGRDGCGHEDCSDPTCRGNRVYVSQEHGCTITAPHNKQEASLLHDWSITIKPNTFTQLMQIYCVYGHKAMAPDTRHDERHARFLFFDKQ